MNYGTGTDACGNDVNIFLTKASDFTLRGKLMPVEKNVKSN